MTLPWFGRKPRKDKPTPMPVRIGYVGPAASRMLDFDQNLLWVIVLLLAFGLVMVYSATVAIPEDPHYARWSQFHFFWRDLAAVTLGLVGGWVVFQFPMKVWERWAPYLFVISLVMLVAVLVPFLGKGVNGSRRWIPLGVFNFQPSELVKLTIILYAADFIVRKQDVKQRFGKAFLPMAAALGFIGVLLLAEPDMGAFLVIASVAMVILFLGGVNGKMFTALTVVMIGAFVLMIVLSPWRRDRIFAYLNPWAEANAQGSAYQLAHALIAMGRGHWLGVGLGGSVEKLHYLPEPQTDFLLAIIGEELGFAGVLAVTLVFAWITKRAFDIGRQALASDRMFSALVAQGVGVLIGGQAFINIGVNLGLLPTKGLTLPLLSYGGSATLVSLLALAILLRVDFENRVLMRGGHV
ncbi:MAG: putative lipid II flippase FtsW [Betaproteobacteria bacterium]|jgi:cell division protein FtsW|nr:putative lipid II flippase FtsW [Betaproteobacteria bacterium]OZB61372.1 MAG: putative lipid II flippase FtsW [Thiomonas sp. 13-66-29]